MSLSKAEHGLAVKVNSDGGVEVYPKARRTFAQPQDWRFFAKVNLRVRVKCADPEIRNKNIALVFYDERTRLGNLPGSPMKQQIVFLSIPVNRWTELNEWLTAIERSAIRQLDLYLYETPPEKAHEYKWEIAKLELESTGDAPAIFDLQVYDRSQMRGVIGKPVGSVATHDGLELEIGDKREISRLAIGENSFGAARRNCPSGLLVRDVAKNGPPVMVGGTVKQSGRDIVQTSLLDDIGLKVTAAYTAHEGYTEITGTVADVQSKDRAVTVYLAIPVAEESWNWWDSATTSRNAVDELQEFVNLETGMGYGLGGSHSKYPLGAITLPERAGLTLAIRMDEPVVHRIAYHPGLRLFYLAMDFGLVPECRTDGRPLSEASFRFLIYRHDPTWGFRSALHRYYEFFPDFFTKRVTKEGGWFVWGNMSKSAGALDAGFGFHWGPEGADAVKWDNDHGPLALFYIEPQTYQQTMEDFDHPPSTKQVLERLRKLIQGDKQELIQVESQPYRVYPLSAAEGIASDHIRTTTEAVTKSLNHDGSGPAILHHRAVRVDE